MTQTPIGAAGTPAPLPLARVLRAYLMETKYEILAALRMPGFALPFIAVPVAVYLLFAVVINGNAATTGESSPGLANYLFSGFSVMAVMMPGIFSGVILATDREGNVLRLKRALPVPPGATIVAKVLMAMGIAAIAVTLVAALAMYTGKLTISTGQIATIWGVLILGTIPFAAIGLLIGSLASSAAAPAYGNLIFLPMLWLSGLFIPLPAFLRTWVVLWPAFHLNQAALGAARVTEFIYIPVTIAIAVLTGVTVLCGGLAIRRLARVG
jgi:ABC-2 type transport system permease protein